MMTVDENMHLIVFQNLACGKRLCCIYIIHFSTYILSCINVQIEETDNTFVKVLENGKD